MIVKSKKSVSEARIKDKDQLYLSTLGKYRDKLIYWLIDLLINGLKDSWFIDLLLINRLIGFWISGFLLNWFMDLWITWFMDQLNNWFMD